MYRYEIKYPSNGSFTYGIAQSFGKEAEQAKKSGRVLVAHAVFPVSHLVPETDVEDIERSFGQFDGDRFWGCDELSDYVTLQEIKHEIVDEQATGLVGRLFSIGVGDGSAHYVITKETKTLVTVEWRGFCPDRWTAPVFGWGGKFRKKDVQNFVRGKKLFGKPKNLKQQWEKYSQSFIERFGKLPKDLQNV